jgi:2-dehydro-3-deoxyphosphogluconate aldolase/(4S)-4-hydroxy-2-oxoglutarate aldolase
MKTFDAYFSDVPVIGILRGIPADALEPVIDAAVDGGLTCIEITLNTPGALELIKRAADRCGPRTCVGAGTVLTAENCGQAVDAGASFIVAPNTNASVMKVCRERSVPAIPGALTPTEVQAAWEAGAFMVKVFPVSLLGGPAYIKELRGPFDATRLLACGGVTLENLDRYFSAGADGIAIGGSVFRADAVARKAFGDIREEIRRFVEAVPGR